MIRWAFRWYSELIAKCRLVVCRLMILDMTDDCISAGVDIRTDA